MIRNKLNYIVLSIALPIIFIGCVTPIMPVKGMVIWSEDSRPFCGVVYQESEDNTKLPIIEGVEVTMKREGNKEETTITDNKGNFGFQIKFKPVAIGTSLEEQMIELTFSKKGYISVNQTIIIHDSPRLLGKEIVKCYLVKE